MSDSEISPLTLVNVWHSLQESPWARQCRCSLTETIHVTGSARDKPLMFLHGTTAAQGMTPAGQGIGLEDGPTGVIPERT